MTVAGVAEDLARHQEHVGLQIGVGSWHLAGRDLPSERCRRLDRERIRRDVLRTKGQRFVEGSSPGPKRLSVRAVDQVEAQVAEPRPPRSDNRGADGRGLVDPFQRPEDRGIEGLRPDRQPREPRLEQPGQRRFGHGVRIRLGRDLGVGRHLEAVAQVRQQRAQVRRLHRRRGPAAQEHADEFGPRPARRGQLRLAEQRREVPRFQPIQPGVGVEVAVAASRETERDVDVDPGRRAHFFFAPSSTRSAAMNASCGTSTLPTRRMRSLPFFWVSRSFRLRVMSPP